MNYYDGTFQASVVDSLQTLYNELLSFVPRFVAAIIILLLAWLIATFLARIVFKIFEYIKIDSLANRLGLAQLSDRVGRPMSVARFGEWLVKWFFIIAGLVAAADILGLTQVSLFLYNRVIPYFGNVIVAVLILLLGILAADFLSGMVKGTLTAGQMKSAHALATVTRWSILIFSLLAALYQLNIASTFLQDLFRAIVAMFAIAGGLAFGLGGRDHAKRVLDAVESDLKR